RQFWNLPTTFFELRLLKLESGYLRGKSGRRRPAAPGSNRPCGRTRNQKSNDEGNKDFHLRSPCWITPSLAPSIPRDETRRHRPHTGGVAVSAPWVRRVVHRRLPCSAVTATATGTRGSCPTPCSTAASRCASSTARCTCTTGTVPAPPTWRE